MYFVDEIVAHIIMDNILETVVYVTVPAPALFHNVKHGLWLIQVYVTHLLTIVLELVSVVKELDGEAS